MSKARSRPLPGLGVCTLFALVFCHVGCQPGLVVGKVGSGEHDGQPTDDDGGSSGEPEEGGTHGENNAVPLEVIFHFDVDDAVHGLARDESRRIWVVGENKADATAKLRRFEDSGRALAEIRSITGVRRLTAVAARPGTERIVVGGSTSDRSPVIAVTGPNTAEFDGFYAMRSYATEYTQIVNLNTGGVVGLRHRVDDEGRPICIHQPENQCDYHLDHLDDQRRHLENYGSWDGTQPRLATDHAHAQVMFGGNPTPDTRTLSTWSPAQPSATRLGELPKIENLPFWWHPVGDEIWDVWGHPDGQLMLQRRDAQLRPLGQHALGLAQGQAPLVLASVVDPQQRLWLVARNRGFDQGLVFMVATAEHSDPSMLEILADVRLQWPEDDSLAVDIHGIAWTEHDELIGLLSDSEITPSGPSVPIMFRFAPFGQRD